MEKNTGNFSMENIMQLAKSPAGQQLIAMLQNADSAALRKAMAQATAGNYSQAKESLAPLLESEDIKTLLQQMGGQSHG